jgi:hypothetical protein
MPGDFAGFPFTSDKRCRSAAVSETSRSNVGDNQSQNMF